MKKAKLNKKSNKNLDEDLNENLNKKLISKQAELKVSTSLKRMLILGCMMLAGMAGAAILAGSLPGLIVTLSGAVMCGVGLYHGDSASHEIAENIGSIKEKIANANVQATLYNEKENFKKRIQTQRKTIDEEAGISKAKANEMPESKGEPNSLDCK